MSVLFKTAHRVAGSVKFDETVPQEKLVNFVTKLRARHPERWVDLHVRKAGDDGTHYIAFHVTLDDDNPSTHERMVNAILQFFRDQLGARPKKNGESGLVPLGVKGWSIDNVIAMG